MVPVRDNAEVLVGHFLVAAPKAFSFIVAAQQYRGQTTLHQASSRGLETTTPDKITSWFWAVWGFGTQQLAGEVRFGDRELALSVVAAPPNVSPEFELWEWSELAEAPLTIRPGDGQFCETLSRLDRELERFAEILGSLWDRIAANGAADLAALRDRRSARHEAFVAAGRDARHSQARADADEAFRKGDFSRVLKLLAPFEAILTPSERAKVAIARRRTTSAPG